MDSGKAPNYRTSYLFRFHPYARVKPSARELVRATLYTSDEDDPVSYEQSFIASNGTVVPDSNASIAIAEYLANTVHVTHSVDALRRTLSLFTVMVVKPVVGDVSQVTPYFLTASGKSQSQSFVSRMALGYFG
ncbi:hypothetical protein EDD16DRAFT_1702257 [Pisolithus croceorrhizus]|nr:hypothetical protein EV401DRAFT_2073763 [Pisolithus croceorrhizus]KAI6127928.1 hypothetical protein EDD16DRAFT_1702257 [Pisolithus croceorrhizus]KAI6158536.1 hypothetical protein EDD17DRAFT_1877310 [Pisolithus thermaeus]